METLLIDCVFFVKLLTPASAGIPQCSLTKVKNLVLDIVPKLGQTLGILILTYCGKGLTVASRKQTISLCVHL